MNGALRHRSNARSRHGWAPKHPSNERRGEPLAGAGLAVHGAMKVATTFSLGLASLTFGALLAAPATARAGIEACGDIHVEASAECEVMVEGGCEAQCEPFRMEAACAAELYAECQGQCEASASAECTGSCEADCQAQCEVDPGTFDCRASCEGDCQASCDGRCSSDDSECRASCEAACSGECDARCEVEPPEASCDARCEASCEGSCQAQASLDCQIDCQAEGYVDCEARLQGGCEAECREPEGALFCDGQYVDHGGNLQECIDALENLNITVEGSASGRCANGRCEGEASGSVGCVVAPSRGNPAGPLALSALVLLLTALGRRRPGAA